MAFSQSPLTKGAQNNMLVNQEVNRISLHHTQNRSLPCIGKGEPQICDFGMAAITEERDENTVSNTGSSAAIVRYAAPELLENNNFSATKECDTYSFAMLMVECITEDAPFSSITHDAVVIHARISKRQYPPRPDGLEDRLWDLMNRCWLLEPDQRPAMELVHSFFKDQNIDVWGFH